MKSKTLLVIATFTTLIFTGCQNNNLSAENQVLKQQITKLQQQVTALEQQNNETILNADTIEELSEMVDTFIVSVGSATPDINNSGNLEQFFFLKREADQIEHALENYENSLENQYRAGTISRENYRKSDKKIEQLEELVDSAFDRLEIAFGIDD